MEERFASYFKEMEWSRQHAFEGGRLQGGQPFEEVYTAVTRTYFTKEKYMRLFQYTVHLRASDRFIVAGEYWLRDDLSVWKVPLCDNENFSLSKAEKIEGNKAVEILTVANSNGLLQERDELLKLAIETNR